MNSIGFTRFMQKEVSERNIDWHIQEVAGVVFIQGSNRNLQDSNNLVTVSFFSKPPLFEFTEEGEEHKSTILAIWEKYLANKEDQVTGGAGKGVLNDTYSTVTLIVIVGMSFLCLLAVAGGIYLSYLLFGG